jgi:hypothetical protein
LLEPVSPPLSVQEALTRELQMAFDDLPEHEKPENKAKLWMFNDFGQQAQSGQRLT